MKFAEKAIVRATDRRREDSRIVAGVARLSLAKRWKRLDGLVKKITDLEAALVLKRDATGTQKNSDEKAIRMAERRLSEMKVRLQLERSEYQNLKAITPDFREPEESREPGDDA
jgi:hypothetical protein